MWTALRIQAEYWEGVSDTARQFVRSCLTIDPTNRPTAGQLLEHKWLKQGAPQSAGNVDLLPNVKAAFDGKKTCTWEDYR
jgi:calcium/calmodulin-dependent protein kinase I